MFDISGMGMLPYDPFAQQPPGTPPMTVPGAAPPPPVGGLIPETVAQQFAQLGIGPQGVINSGSVGAPPALGESLNPQPPAAGPPLSLAPPGVDNSAPAPAAAGAPGTPPLADRLKGALRGVQQPSYTPQKVATPSAPRPTSQIKGGEWLALLQALGQAPGANSFSLPTLATTIGR